MLFELFNQIGPVASIRVCRDAVTRRSLGYAYVNFHNPLDGERALDAVNYSIIKDRPCRIMWSQRDPSLRKKGSGNVFIKNLDKAIDSKALYDTFSAFGHILSCKVAMDENGSRGYGFVHFAEMESAEKAIKSVNGMLLNDKKVYVGLHVPRRERESKEEEFKKNFTNVFVKNIPESVDDQKFAEMFEAYGAITSAALTKDENGKSKGFGFVNFEDHEAADKAVEEMNEKEIDGKALFVGRAQKKSEREEELRKKFDQLRLERMNKYQGVNLYVKNLDETIDDDRLRQEFAVYGAITSARVMVDDKGASKGFGFVCFNLPEEATKAVTEMNGKIVGNKPMYVALAQRRDARKAMLEAQYNARQQFRQTPGMIPMYGAPMMYPPAQPGMQAGFMYPGQMGGQMGRPGMPYPGMPPQAFPGNRMPRQPNQGPRGRGMPPNGMMYPGGPIPPQQQGGPMPPRGPPLAQQQLPPQQQQQQQLPPQQQQQQMRPNVKYNQQVRNGPVPAPAPAQPGQITAAALAKLDPAQQRQIIGERLYVMVQGHEEIKTKHPEMSGKITGMLLEMEVSELLHLLEAPDAFETNLGEAVAVWENYLQQHTATAEKRAPELGFWLRTKKKNSHILVVKIAYTSSCCIPL